MAPEYNLSNATNTELQNVTSYSVKTEVPDSENASGETYYDFPDAARHLGYYKNIPEIKSALKALSIWVAGIGYTVPLPIQKTQLDKVSGTGKESFQSIMQSMLIEKKVFGDAFAEIIRSDSGTFINLKKLYPGDMRIVYDSKGTIIRYEHRAGKEKVVKLAPEKILHLSNDRVADEIHGTSIIDSLKFIIDAKNEALSDERKIRHRELALGILEVETNQSAKIAQAKAAYKSAVENGEVLVIPKGTAEIKDTVNKPRDRLQWLQYLDNLFYQVVGVPKVIVTSEGFTEAGGKVGFLTFEPVYTAEQAELEAELWNQIAIKVKFNRPPSLSGMMQSSEEKNTGQTGIQPNETKLTPQRNE